MEHTLTLRFNTPMFSLYIKHESQLAVLFASEYNTERQQAE